RGKRRAPRGWCHSCRTSSISCARSRARSARTQLRQKPFAAARLKRRSSGHFGTGVPCKARPDYLPAHGRWIVDLKTAASVNPRSWRDQAYRLGYHARAAWYLDGCAAVLGQAPEEYWFVLVEKEPPYLVSVVSFDQDALAWGRIAK